MREIKFRAWNTVIKEMFDDNHYQRPRNCDIFRWVEDEGQPFIPMQFTGLLDKSGKEIYDGDVVKDGIYQGVVKYRSDDHGCAFYIDRNEFGDGGFGHLNREMEVIGNIYENPELLKKGAKDA